MKGSMNSPRQGKTDDKNRAKMSTTGSGSNKRDSAVATGTPKGGSTKMIDKRPGNRGSVTMSKGSFKSYR